MIYPKPIDALIYQLSKLPGIGNKSAQRMAFHILSLSKKEVSELAYAIEDINDKVVKCKRCNSLTDNDLCFICSDANRNINTLCIVEDTRELMSIEDTRQFNGYYYVLGALLSPMKKIGPEELGIEKLLEIIKNNDIEEIIMAISPTVEGESTILFLGEILKGMGKTVTQLAQGISMGSSLEYYDQFTLSMAMKERKSL